MMLHLGVALLSLLSSGGCAPPTDTPGSACPSQSSVLFLWRLRPWPTHNHCEGSPKIAIGSFFMGLSSGAEKQPLSPRDRPIASPQSHLAFDCVGRAIIPLFTPLSLRHAALGGCNSSCLHVTPTPLRPIHWLHRSDQGIEFRTAGDFEEPRKAQHAARLACDRFAPTRPRLTMVLQRPTQPDYL
ncbi:hypothetical protein BGZ61DRAFT_216581 [Ilyonectria robusta]|uniref:uncharacterized protein n=1 Tax=Ilyonectria robusta TaxID=1079257 RepID=UPI001E8E46DC|nr:uncharacterized protein BGZ61DRAFT_216581 [Ilyonectria robusta]KAH8652850.1 hypothetical protein BGZ61DRAFT_216581 [Ilyonectria robusta]